MITAYWDFHRSFFQRQKAIFVLCAVVSSSSCKPRVDHTVSKTASSTEDVQYAASPIAVAQAEAVKTACGGVTASLIRGVRSGAIDFVVTKTDSEVGAETIQPQWFEEANFKDELWHLSSAIKDPSTPSFLRGRRTLSTKEFVAALGCTKLRIVDVHTENCPRSQCEVTLAQASFDLPGTNMGTDTALALSGSKETSCEKRGQLIQLVGPGNAYIGNPVGSENECQMLLDSTHNGLVCAWTGVSFDLYRVDGVRISDAGGVKSLSACIEQTKTFSKGLVCALDADGFFLSRVENNPTRLGSGGTILKVCSDRIASSTKQHVCSADANGIWVFDLASGKPKSEFGSFDDETDCRAVLVALGDAKIANLLKDNVKSASEITISNKSGDESSTNGLSLAGVGYTYADCHDPSRGYHIVQTDSSGNLICKMDTLYSWGPRAKIQWLKEQPWSGMLRRNGNPQPVFATQSPFATFGYGEYAIRFRLKENVRYKYISEGQLKNPYEYCNQLSSGQLENTVIVRWWKNSSNYTGLDFILCSMGPVHSWSHGTQEHLNEINADADWIRSHDYKEYELYVKRNGVDVQLPDRLDGHTFTNAIFRANLTRHAQDIGNEIFYSPSAEKKSAFWHFNTKWPIYFNPK